MDIEELLNGSDDDIFELLEKPPTFKVDSNFEKIKEKIDNIPNIDECKKKELERIHEKDAFAKKRISKMKDAQFRYAYHSEERILHDRSCKLVKKIPDEFFDMRRDFDYGMRVCRECHVRALIRACIDDQKDMEMTEQILKRLYAKREDVVELLTRKNIVISCISTNLIEFVVNDDTWRITVPRKNNQVLRLWHNNYRIENGNRIIEDGFHEQVINGRVSFRAASQIMINYKSQFHVEELRRIAREEQRESDMHLEMAPDNDVQIKQDNFNISTAVRLKRFSLFYNRYMFIDTKMGHHRTVFLKRKIHYKLIREMYCNEFVYGVIICDIPRWHRKKMFAAINRIKNGMYKEGHGRGYLCGLCMMRELKKNGVRFETYI